GQWTGAHAGEPRRLHPEGPGRRACSYLPRRRWRGDTSDMRLSRQRAGRQSADSEPSEGAETRCPAGHGARLDRGLDAVCRERAWERPIGVIERDVAPVGATAGRGRATLLIDARRIDTGPVEVWLVDRRRGGRLAQGAEGSARGARLGPHPSGR